MYLCQLIYNLALINFSIFILYLFFLYVMGQIIVTDLI